LTKIAARYYQFKPYGVTGIILLAESHISIHSWPEHELATIDIYTCGDFNKAHIASNLLISLLQPEYYEKLFYTEATLRKTNYKNQQK